MLARKFRPILLRPLKPVRGIQTSGRRQADVIAMGMEACLDTMSAGPKDRRGKGTVFQPWLNVDNAVCATSTILRFSLARIRKLAPSRRVIVEISI
jgi:hypothetical protein